MHWAVKYIGTRYVEGARGPDAFDCWGIIKLIYAQEWHIELPDLPGLSAPQLQEIHDAIEREVVKDWHELAKPEEGCVVAMGHSATLHHVGIWVDCDGGKVLNSRAGANTVVDKLRGLRLRGFRVIKFYQHNLWPG